MPYEKTQWVSGGTPALDADKLNKMENGIAAALEHAGGKMTGQIADEGSTIYATKQVRNIIISNGDPDPSKMQNGDIWFKWV